MALLGIGALNGSLAAEGRLNGSLSGNNGLSGSLSLPNSVSGTSNYERLINKPSIEYVTLIGNKDFSDLGLTAITADDLLEILV